MHRDESSPEARSSLPDDSHWMRRALDLAENGAGMTAPNPPVGAVIVRDGTVIGEGWHSGAGMPHAEVEAFNNLSVTPDGATLYVTLEPCSTFGRTPPCTELIIGSNITRVVIGTEDPNPLHAGRGITILRESGILVDVGVMGPQSRDLIAGFSSLMLRKRPLLTLKLGMTLDGRIADANGLSQWITGESARDEVQRLRRASDAVMVGIGTVLADDPSLRCRMVGAPAGRRVVIDPHGRIPPSSTLLSDSFANETVVVTGMDTPEPVRRGWEETGAGSWILPYNADGRFDSKLLLARMGEEGWMRVLCEGGAGLAGTLMDDGVVDEIYAFLAPSVLGGDALSAIGGRGFGMSSIRRGTFSEVRRFGDDLMVRLSFD